MEKLKFSKLFAALFCCVCAFTAVSCDDDDDDVPAPPKTLTFSSNSSEVAVGENDTIVIRGGQMPYYVVSSDSAVVTAFAEDSLLILTGTGVGEAGVYVTDQEAAVGSIKVSVKDNAE